MLATCFIQLLYIQTIWRFQLFIYIRYLFSYMQISLKLLIYKCSKNRHHKGHYFLK